MNFPAFKEEQRHANASWYRSASALDTVRDGIQLWLHQTAAEVQPRSADRKRDRDLRVYERKHWKRCRGRLSSLSPPSVLLNVRVTEASSASLLWSITTWLRPSLALWTSASCR